MKRIATLLVLVLAACSSTRSTETPHVSSGDPWADLAAGNARFVAGHATHPHDFEAQRRGVAESQSPFAIVLTCADSRVTPEFVFDQGIGDLFVCRVAGNTPGPLALGSMEYAAEHLHSSLLVVMGHERCGAVKAAMDGGKAPGNIQALVDAITPRIKGAKSLDEAVDANVRGVVAEIRAKSPVLAHLEHDGKLKIVGARYDLDTGEVTVVE